MRPIPFAVLAAVALGVAGCDDGTVVAPRDLTPPAAPRGLYSVTGDHEVVLRWLANTEADVAGYRVYFAPCASGSGCPYDRVGTTSAATFAVTGLANGVTRYFAVAAVDNAGNESALSYETVFDTPRPEGFGASLNNFVATTAGAGWDFSLAAPRSSSDPATDMYFGFNGSVYQMFVPDYATDIQDAGFGGSLDAVDFAPSGGWSPTGTVELIPGHCYVVWTRDDHYAKFRVSGLASGQVTFDWAYQTDTGNRELRARPAHGGEASRSRPVAWIR